MNSFLEDVKNRRSCYALSAKSPISDQQIEEIVKSAVQYAPTAFNSQGARVLVLLGARHQAFWALTRAALKAVVPTEQFTPTEEKIQSFCAAYGTILYFEEWASVSALQAQFPAYKDNFPIWAMQANGMLEFIIWTALEKAGLGASLQHYNPLVDDAVQKEFATPPTWKLVAQMPFGLPIAAVGEKTFLPLEDRVKIMK